MRTILPAFLATDSKKSSQLCVRDVLDLEALAPARLVAGASGLERPVLWSHVVDMPDPAPWVPPGYFLLTTGYSWPKDRRRAACADRGAGRNAASPASAWPCRATSPSFSKAEREAADAAGLPLVEIPFEIPFARVTEELHRAIMAEPYRVIDRAEQIHHALMRAASREATLDDLARILCPLIGRSVTFEDPGGKLLAHLFDRRSRRCSAPRDARTQRKRRRRCMAALEAAGLDRQLARQRKTDSRRGDAGDRLGGARRVPDSLGYRTRRRRVDSRRRRTALRTRSSRCRVRRAGGGDSRRAPARTRIARSDARLCVGAVACSNRRAIRRRPRRERVRLLGLRSRTRVSRRDRAVAGGDAARARGISAARSRRATRERVPQTLRRAAARFGRAQSRSAAASRRRRARGAAHRARRCRIDGRCRPFVSRHAGRAAQLPRGALIARLSQSQGGLFFRRRPRSTRHRGRCRCTPDVRARLAGAAARAARRPGPRTRGARLGAHRIPHARNRDRPRASIPTRCATVSTAPPTCSACDSTIPKRDSRCNCWPGSWSSATFRRSPCRWRRKTEDKRCRERR